MTADEPNLTGIYRHTFTVPDAVVDQNGHVNNVAYIQWMQDVAIRHSDATGGTAATRRAGAAWVVRSHQIEYLKPAFAGDVVMTLTWVADFRRVKSLRRYRFVRQSDGAVLATGATDWVLVDTQTGRPMKIPETVLHCFPVVADGNLPAADKFSV